MFNIRSLKESNRNFGNTNKTHVDKTKLFKSKCSKSNFLFINDNLQSNKIPICDLLVIEELSHGTTYGRNGTNRKNFRKMLHNKHANSWR